MRNNRRLRMLRLVAVASALPLLQVTCTVDSLSQSFSTELTRSAAQFVFDVSQTVFQNVLGV